MNKESQCDFTVYMHTFPNEKRYIGITRTSLEQRFKNGYAYAYNKEMYDDIQKYGWDNIKHDVICTNLSVKEACNLEIELIREYDTTNSKNGYNITSGGEIGRYKYKKSKKECGEVALGDNIKFYRERKHISQTELAELCGITPSMISQYESNGKIPNFLMGIKIAQILGVSAEKLLNGEN